MVRALYPNEAVEHLKREFEGRITQTLKSLLETKHLYQSITIEYADLLNIYRKRVIEYANEVEPNFKKLIQTNWYPISKHYENPESERLFKIRFQTPDVKMFCKICDRVEAFNSRLSADIFLPQSSEIPSILSGQIVQVFVLSFLCQSCKSVPEVFLVRRQGLKLTNSGRSPIEHVDVPSFIPNSVKSFYRGAILAYQSGETLAGIFMLRTLIEQWARSVVPSTPPDAEKLLEAYMSTLPDDFKRRFPSFRNLYADLSEDMHAAKGDAGLFEKALADIEEHFDARRLYKL